jgi:hypothetical protein
VNSGDLGGDSRDQVAVNAIMGHDEESMASVYREGISDKRLKTVADHVRNWLFGNPRPWQVSRNRSQDLSLKGCIPV